MLTEVTLKLVRELYAQEETFGKPFAMYILSGGMVSKELFVQVQCASFAFFGCVIRSRPLDPLGRLLPWEEGGCYYIDSLHESERHSSSHSS